MIVFFSFFLFCYDVGHHDGTGPAQCRLSAPRPEFTGDGLLRTAIRGRYPPAGKRACFASLNGVVMPPSARFCFLFYTFSHLRVSFLTKKFLLSLFQQWLDPNKRVLVQLKGEFVTSSFYSIVVHHRRLRFIGDC